MITHSDEEECNHVEALLRRAATLITTAWVGTSVKNAGAGVDWADWIGAASRWISDYERRDERVSSTERETLHGHDSSME